MDFVVVGFGLGALTILCGVLLTGVAARRWERAARRAQSPTDADHDLAAAADRRRTGQTLIYAGGAILLATLGAIGGSLDDRTGAFFVVTTVTVAAGGVLFWVFRYRIRHPAPRRRRGVPAAAIASSALDDMAVAESLARLDSAAAALDLSDEEETVPAPEEPMPSDADLEDDRDDAAVDASEDLGVLANGRDHENAAEAVPLTEEAAAIGSLRPRSAQPRPSPADDDDTSRGEAVGWRAHAKRGRPMTPRGPETTETLSPRRLNRATLARQMLLERTELSPVAAVERLAGMQAQEAKPPFVGLWTRLTDFRREDLHRALHEREVVRATLMRGTIHYLSARDYLALRPALQPVLTRFQSILGPRAAGLEIDKVLPLARELLAEEPRTVGELRELLAAAFPAVEDRALGFTVRMSVPLVMIPTADRWAFPADSRFGLAESWLGAPLGADSGPESIALRYLAAFGPATAADVQTWAGLQGIKPVLETLRPQLRAFKDERGKLLFDLPDAPRPDADVPAPPRYLPAFDNLVLSHADRTRVLPDEFRKAVLGSKNLRIPPTFLVDGFVAGVWRVERKRQAATLLLSPFAPLPRDVVRDLEEQGEALVRFLEEDAATFVVKENPPGGGE